MGLAEMFYTTRQVRFDEARERQESQELDQTSRVVRRAPGLSISVTLGLSFPICKARGPVR